MELQWTNTRTVVTQIQMNKVHSSTFSFILNHTSLTLSQNVFNVKNETIHGPVHQDMMQF